jgi:hypothetical protein
VKSPTLGMVEKLAHVMNVHPLTLLTMAYASTADGLSLEEFVSDVYSQVVSLTSPSSSSFAIVPTASQRSPADAKELIDRVKSRLEKMGQTARFLLPQKQIDDAFGGDEEAKDRFKKFGLTLVPARLYGRPGIATIFRERDGGNSMLKIDQSRFSDEAIDSLVGVLPKPKSKRESRAVKG